MPQRLPDYSCTVVELRALVSQQDALEVLDRLTAGGLTVRQLASALHRPRRMIARALRNLAIGGLVTSDRDGSWDDSHPAAVPKTVRYRQTEKGRAAVLRLSSLAVWDALYDVSQTSE
jgi:DNA-binding HxlR family transcriptional regulator